MVSPELPGTEERGGPGPAGSGQPPILPAPAPPLPGTQATFRLLPSLWIGHDWENALDRAQSS